MHATFVMLTWFSAPWWKQLAGGTRVVDCFRQGKAMFTRPDWRIASQEQPVPQQRLFSAPTEWMGRRANSFPYVLLKGSPLRDVELPRLSGNRHEQRHVERLHTSGIRLVR